MPKRPTNKQHWRKPTQITNEHLHEHLVVIQRLLHCIIAVMKTTAPVDPRLADAINEADKVEDDLAAELKKPKP